MGQAVNRYAADAVAVEAAVAAFIDLFAAAAVAWVCRSKGAGHRMHEGTHRHALSVEGAFVTGAGVQVGAASHVPSCLQCTSATPARTHARPARRGEADIVRAASAGTG